MKEIIIVGAVSLAAYYAYQKFLNPSTTPAAVANNLVAQASNLVTRPAIESPIQQPIVKIAIPTTPVIAKPVIATNQVNAVVNKTASVVPISAVNNPTGVKITGMKGLMGLL